MPHPISVENRLPTGNPAGGALLGLVRAEGVEPAHYPAGFDAALADAVAGAQDPSEAEARRVGARDMLRNGRYKPTGRGKPASEYLVRAAVGGSFPRINALVDVNNLVSLTERLPISLWDLDRAADRVRFRLGREGETYVFNTAGQALALHDLAVGCRVRAGEDAAGEPFVSPIKDSHGTKTAPETRRVAAAVYAPANLVTPDALSDICRRFAAWLAGCGDDVETATAVAAPGEAVEL